MSTSTAQLQVQECCAGFVSVTLHPYTPGSFLLPSSPLHSAPPPLSFSLPSSSPALLTLTSSPSPPLPSPPILLSPPPPLSSPLAFRDSGLPPGETYQDVIKRQQEGQIIYFPDHATDAVRDRPRGGPSSDQSRGGPSSDQSRSGPSSDRPRGWPSSDQPQQVPNTASYGTSTASASMVPDSPYYRYGNQQQGNPHMQTSGGVNPAFAEPSKRLVLDMPTSSGTTEEYPQHSDNPPFASSPSSLSIPYGGSRGKSPAISPTQQSTPGYDHLSPSPQIQELLDKRMMIDDPDDRRCLLQLAKRLPKWRYFGLYLNLPESTLAEMDRSGVDADDKAVTMLMQWVKESQTGTRATLVHCLGEVGAVDLMYELKHTGTIKPRDPVK